MSLKQELDRYNQWTVPDYLYDAWRILFEGHRPPDRQEILRQAEQDLHEDELGRQQANFNRDRRKMLDRVVLPFNWSNK